MRIIKNLILLICLPILLSCQRDKVEKVDFVGKWKSYHSIENEYVEWDISKHKIGIFGHTMGNRGLVSYKIVKDTLFINESKVLIKILSKNQFTIMYDGITDTLSRLPDSIITYNTRTIKNDSTFRLFYNKFELRAYNSWIEHGYVTKEELENSRIDGDIIEEEIIPLTNK